MITETGDDLIRRVYEWKDNVENISTIVNMSKTKVVINGE